MDGAMRVVPLKCVSCGAALEISSDMERFACGYCGVNLLVERRGGTVALKKMVDAIAKVQAGTDRTAAELTIKRLSTELAVLENRMSAEVNRQALEMQPLGKTIWNCYLATVVFALFALTWAWVGFSTNDRGTGVVGILGAIFIAAIGVFIAKHFSRVRMTLSTQHEAILKPLRDEWGSIQRKLEVQRAIVDG